MFSTATKQASGVSNSLATLSGEVTSLDKSVIDAVCAFFEYGTNSDLSNAARISGEYDIGVFQDGGGVAFEYALSGLSQGTTYYYRAKGRAIRYDDIDAMDYAAQSSGFMNNLANNSAEMDKVVDQSAAREKIAAYTVAMQEIAASSIAVQKVAPSSEFMKEIVALNSAISTFLRASSIQADFWTVQNGTDELWSSGQYSTSGDWSTWGRDFDLFNVDTIEFYAKRDGLSGGKEIWIDGSTVKTISENTSWTKYSIDVSSYTGIHTFTFAGDGNNNTTEFNLIDSYSGGGYTLRLYLPEYNQYGDISDLQFLPSL